jgi:hypothetical protein
MYEALFVMPTQVGIHDFAAGGYTCRRFLL